MQGIVVLNITIGLGGRSTEHCFNTHISINDVAKFMRHRIEAMADRAEVVFAIVCGADRLCGTERVCSAVQCSAVEWSAVQCSPVQSSAGKCSALQCSAVQCGAVQCSAVQCSAVAMVAKKAAKRGYRRYVFHALLFGVLLC